jgi:hypothetical protein
MANAYFGKTDKVLVSRRDYAALYVNQAGLRRVAAAANIDWSS